MSLISASARRRVAGFFGAMTQRPSQVRSSRQYQILSAPVTGRLLALQSTIKYASNSDMAATAYSRPASTNYTHVHLQISLHPNKNHIGRNRHRSTPDTVVPRNGCKPEPTDNAPASSKASRNIQCGFIRRQTTTLQLRHFPSKSRLNSSRHLTPMSSRTATISSATLRLPRHNLITTRLPDNSTLPPAISRSHPHCPYQVRQNQG